MTEKLIEHINGLFAGAPRTQQMAEFREEIIQNTVDRYNDLISQGKAPDAAYNIAILGIGDISSIIGSAESEQPTAPVYTYTREEIEKNRKKRAMLLTVAVMLYILSVVPLISTGLFVLGAEGTARLEVFGVILMFLMIAVATGLIIYRASTKLSIPKGDEITASDEDKAQIKKRGRGVADTVCDIIWITFTVFYICLSIATKMWSVTWLIFPIIIAVCNIVHAIADLCRK